MPVDIDYVVGVLMRLLAVPSPTGSTAKAIALVESEFEKLGVHTEVTAKGALLATFPGLNTQKHRAIVAHIDTLGAMVKEIKQNGRLKITTLGGYNMHSVEGEYCVVESLGGKTYTGTLLSDRSSVHVYKDAETHERKPENMEIRLDEKVSSVEHVRDLGIEIGDFVHFDTRAELTQSGFIKSRHLDDKAGVAVLLGVAKHLVNHQPAATTHLFVSNFEEVGHGASCGIPTATEEIIALDMGAIGEGQNSDEFSVSICAKDSSGPYDLELRKVLVSVAQHEQIAYKLDIYPFYGSDASAALRAGYNARASVVGPGIDASHSYERTHKDALLNTCRLLNAYLARA